MQKMTRRAALAASERHTSTFTVAELLTKAVEGAEGDKRRVRALSDVLAEVMQNIHGGTFRIDIDHEAAFIVIRQKG